MSFTVDPVLDSLLNLLGYSGISLAAALINVVGHVLALASLTQDPLQELVGRKLSGVSRHTVACVNGIEKELSRNCGLRNSFMFP